MRTLAIDPGTRRVGLALSDAGGKLSTPYDVLTIVNSAQAVDQILKVIEKEGVERLVVGLPLNMDGTESGGSESAVKFGRELAEKSGKPVVFVDERLSSFEAEQSLADRKRGGEKMTRKGKKERLDAVAASLILQAFLDGKIQGWKSEIRNPNDESNPKSE
jgi:putative Holliday junction resolvase